MHGIKSHYLFMGPSGCGKTEIWRVLKKKWEYIYIEDASRITQEGWSGDMKSFSAIEKLADKGIASK